MTGSSYSRGEEGAMPSARAAGASAPEPASRLGLSAASTIAGPGTPLPWKEEGDRLYSAANGMSRGVATGMARQDAAFAARACNNFYGLVEALEAIHELLDDEIGARFRTSSSMSEEQLGRKSAVYSLLSVPRNIARTAIARARGQSS